MVFRVYVTEPLPEVEKGIEVLKGFAEVYIENRFYGFVLPEALRGYDAVIAGDSKITKESLKGADKLKVIGRFGAGVDSVDLEECTKKGIMVVNVPGLNSQSVAEHIIGFMIALSKNFLKVDKLVRQGRWEEKATYIGCEIWRKKLGIVGYGNIGKKLTKIAKDGFDMEILVYDPYIENIESAKKCALEELLKTSDYIALCCPLTKETRDMIGEKELDVMKKDAFLINCARGGLVDEDALYDALKANKIAGAGIDVLENEPVKEHKLFELDNVIVTPHFGAWTKEAFVRVAIKCCEEIKKALEGEVPENLVNRIKK